MEDGYQMIKRLQMKPFFIISLLEKTYNFYGMLVVKESERGLEIIKEYSTLTSDKFKALRLISLCNKLEISEIFVDDIVEDFIFSENGED